MKPETSIKKLSLKKGHKYILFFDTKTGVTKEDAQRLTEMLADIKCHCVVVKVDTVEGVKVVESEE